VAKYIKYYPIYSHIGENMGYMAGRHEMDTQNVVA